MRTRSGAYEEFRALLRAARLAAGLSQAQVARRLGKPQSYVSKCESGERRVDVVELAQFARVYGVAYSYFFGGRAASRLPAVAEATGEYRHGRQAPVRRPTRQKRNRTARRDIPK